MILSELELSEEKRKGLFHSIQDFYDLSLTPLEQLSALVGEPTLRILSRADRVETFRIEKNLHLDELFEGRDDKSQEEVDRIVAERRKKFPEIEGYDLVKAGPVQNNDFARRLLNGLASEGASLVWTDCGFSPVVLFRAWADKESTNLLVCFGCYQIAVLTRDTNGKTVAADFSSFHMFPKGESVFRKLGLESFPNDPVLLSVR
jgi:hypothetical protein